jgi:TatD DNase family protein
MLIDTHCHLNDPQLYPQADELVARALRAGVGLMQVVAYDEPSSRTAIELADRFPEVFAIVGVHPTEIDENLLERLSAIETLSRHKKVIAIGETGLDYYWEKNIEARQRQKEAFVAQIEMADRLGLPIVVHSREAMEDTLEILKTHPPKHGGVMHCYSGSTEMVKDFLDLGMYISLGGPVTFLNARVPKEVALAVPEDRLLIETDSPYLAPHPFRGKRNEPSLLPLVAQAIAAIKGVPLTSVEQTTSANALRLFHVKLK